MSEFTQSTGSELNWMDVFAEDAEDLPDEDIAALGYWDPTFYCKFFLNHLFSEPMPWIHRAVLAVITNRCRFLEKYGELDKLTTNFGFEENGTPLQLFYYQDGKLQMRRRKYMNLLLPRGCSKTTLVGIAVPTYEPNYQDCDFTVYVSEAGPHATMHVDSIKNELSF